MSPSQGWSSLEPGSCEKEGGGGDRLERQVPARWVERAGGTVPRLRPRGWRWQGTGGMGCPGALQGCLRPDPRPLPAGCDAADGHCGTPRG